MSSFADEVNAILLYLCDESEKYLPELIIDFSETVAGYIYCLWYIYVVEIVLFWSNLNIYCSVIFL